MNHLVTSPLYLRTKEAILIGDHLYLGIDVSKTEHHATGITATGTVVHDKPLPQSEPKIRALLEKLTIENGPVLVVVDQPKTIGALAAEITQTRNRMRSFLAQIHPALEQVLGPRLAHPAVAALLTRYSSPERIKIAGRGAVRQLLRKHAPRLVESLTEEIFTALAEQAVTITGTGAAEKIIGRLAQQLQQFDT